MMRLYQPSHRRLIFFFNVIVVDNHSTDGTTEILSSLAADERLVHLIPTRTDLCIGGCWNYAVNDAHCGRFAVQLDSDDLYFFREYLAGYCQCFSRAEGCNDCRFLSYVRLRS